MFDVSIFSTRKPMSRSGAVVALLIFDLCSGAAEALFGEFSNICGSLSQSSAALILSFGSNFGELHQDEPPCAVVFRVYAYGVRGGA